MLAVEKQAAWSNKAASATRKHTNPALVLSSVSVQQYSSTPSSVLEYCFVSIRVLTKKYWSIGEGVLHS